MSEIDYKKLCEEYEKRMGIGKNSPARDGYLVLVRLLNEQNEYLKVIKIKDLISSDDAAKKIEYKNAKDLWEGLPKMIQNVEALKIELKMTGEESRNIDNKPISPQSVALNGHR